MATAQHSVQSQSQSQSQPPLPSAPKAEQVAYLRTLFTSASSASSAAEAISSSSSRQSESDVWSRAWQEKVTPWDSGGDAQALLVGFWEGTKEGETLRSELGSKKRERNVLVPGCGKGYDLVYLASLATTTTTTSGIAEEPLFGRGLGVDVAPEAVIAARSWLEKDCDEALRGQVADRVEFQTADYFDPMAPELANEEFDLIYDYTFFCALPPSLREVWGKSHARRSKKAEGWLLCLVYPIQGDREGGPPYSVSPEMYHGFLGQWFVLHYEGVPPGGKKERAGMEKIMLWKRNDKEVQ